MKQASLIFIFLVSPLLCLKAQDSVEKIISLIKKSKSIDLVQKHIGSAGHFRFWNLTRRKIDGGHEQLICAGDYNMLLQQDDKGIYLAVITRTLYSKTKDSILNILFEIIPSRFNRFAAIHDSIYHSVTSSLSYKHFIANRYGVACGSSAEQTPAIRQMVSFVKEYDTSSLRNWICDNDYEKKIIGATGLLILERKGMTLNNDDVAKIEHLRNLNLPIMYCHGCTVWQPESSGDLLNEKSISYCISIWDYIQSSD
ncbi:MAG TPA: hypothetical protein VN451_01800 [Chitinophagaceae bacterium]|nr:hypothetical protein [Chitinophagaceae bacterium]